MKNKPRILRITTVPISLQILLKGQLSFFVEQGFEVLAVSAAGKEVSSLSVEGINHKVVPMTRRITPFQDLRCLLMLVSIIRDFKPDIIHTHTPKAGLLGMLAGWLCCVPVRLHTVAGLPLMESNGITKKLLLFTERLTYLAATNVYPNSVGLHEYIVKYIRTKTPLKIIGRGSSNGINTCFFKYTPALEQASISIRQKHGIGTNDIVFSFVGRIVKDKGMSELITAFKQLANVNGDQRIILLLIGSFERDLDPLDEDEIKFLHESNNVILAGFQNDVRPWIMASDIFVFPSYREGFPNVVMQSCCLEVPCIVSDINGCNEIIKHNVTGLVVKPKDANALYLAMSKLKADLLLRKQFSESAKQFVISNYDQQLVWQELLREYKMLLKNRY